MTVELKLDFRFLWWFIQSLWFSEIFACFNLRTNGQISMTFYIMLSHWRIPQVCGLWFPIINDDHMPIHKLVKWAQPQHQFRSPLTTMPIVTTVTMAVAILLISSAKLSEAVGSITKLFSSAESHIQRPYSTLLQWNQHSNDNFQL